MDKLGIQLPALLMQIVNFTIMLLILTKLLYKPILKVLKDRKQKIAEGLNYVDKMKLEEEKFSKKQEEMFVKARQEVKVILENGKKDALAHKAEILESGKKEIATMKSKMEKDMEAKLEEMQEEISKRTVDIAASMVERLLDGLLTSEQQHKLIQKELKKLEKRHEK